MAGLSSIAGGMVIDLRKLNGIEPAERPGEFWIGGGALAGQVADYLGDRALAVPLGDSSAVRIGGITLGGGTGWLTRNFGLTLDSLTAAEVVLADGLSSIVDESHNPDLFWALRRGGGNFGVVTRLRFRSHKLTSVVGGTMTLTLSAKTLRRVINMVEAAPEELGIRRMFQESEPRTLRHEEADRSRQIFYIIRPFVGRLDDFNHRAALASGAILSRLFIKPAAAHLD